MFAEPFQVYVLAPEAVTVAEPPSHISVVDDTTAITGSAFTVTETAATLVLVHPAVLVPVTEYDPVAVGANGAPSATPPVHE